MGRYKYGAGGQLYYDVNDFGPDQGAPLSTSAPNVAPGPSQEPLPRSEPVADTAQPEAPQDFGNPRLNQIADIFRQYGVTPTAQLVNQWGTNIDDNYMRAIAAQIQKVYGQAAQSAPAATSAPAADTSADWWNPSDPQGSFMKLVAGKPPSPDTLASLEPQLKAAGIELLRNAQGVPGKIRLPGGQVVDVGVAFSSGNPSAYQWAWQVGGGAEDSGGTGSAGVNASYLQPFTAAFDPSKAAGVPSWALTVPEWKAPDPREILNDPTYLWTTREGQKAIQRSAAAKGTLNSGGTLADIYNYQKGNAADAYQNLYNRKYQDWTTQAGANTEAYNRAWNQYLNQKDTFYQNQNQPFDKLYRTSSLGAQAAAA